MKSKLFEGIYSLRKIGQLIEEAGATTGLYTDICKAMATFDKDSFVEEKKAAIKKTPRSRRTSSSGTCTSFSRTC